MAINVQGFDASPVGVHFIHRGGMSKRPRPYAFARKTKNRTLDSTPMVIFMTDSPHRICPKTPGTLRNSQPPAIRIETTQRGLSHRCSGATRASGRPRTRFDLRLDRDRSITSQFTFGFVLCATVDTVRKNRSPPQAWRDAEAAYPVCPVVSGAHALSRIAFGTASRAVPNETHP